MTNPTVVSPTVVSATVTTPTVFATIQSPTIQTPTVFSTILPPPTIKSATVLSPTVSPTVSPTIFASVYCGDGVVQKERGEQCDLGRTNGYSGYNCSATCRILIIPTCGNGTVDVGEECDDGNLRDFDGCSAQCKSEVGGCGDGKIEEGFGEECDDGAKNGTDQSICDATCKVKPSPYCGDGIVNEDLGEQCDNGGANSEGKYTTCVNCRLPKCGNGKLENDEQCDDGNLFAWDGCDQVCQVEITVAAAESSESPIGKTKSDTYVNGQLIPGQTTYGRLPSNIPTPARTPTGPGLVIFLASGAAAGVGVVRRRYLGR